VNRRMHNKAFIVDNQAAVVGGRNMAAEYFSAHEDNDFGDLDVLCFGPVTAEVSTMFDTYWNHRAAVPVPRFAEMPEDQEAAKVAFRERMADFHQEFLKTPYAEALENQVAGYLQAKSDKVFWGKYTIAYDSPDKVVKGKVEASETIRAPLFESLKAAQGELLIVSPYFVPRKKGVEGLIEIQKRGVDIVILTNSLAANNQKIVHGGYMPSRKKLLKAGVRMFEMKPRLVDADADAVPEGAKQATLHAKVFIVDQKDIYIGSFNFDPRSAYINTESGVIIESPELSAYVGNILNKHAKVNMYEVFLNEKEQLRWKTLEEGKWVTFKTEPATTFGERFKARLVGLLPIKSQL